MSSDNLKRYDQRFHVKQGADTTFKCDFSKATFVDLKKALWSHNKTLKKCPICAKIFPTPEPLETHEKTVHEKENQKTRLTETL